MDPHFPRLLAPLTQPSPVPSLTAEAAALLLAEGTEPETVGAGSFGSLTARPVFQLEGRICWVFVFPDQKQPLTSRITCVVKLRLCVFLFSGFVFGLQRIFAFTNFDSNYIIILELDCTLTF